MPTFKNNKGEIYRAGYDMNTPKIYVCQGDKNKAPLVSAPRDAAARLSPKVIKPNAPRLYSQPHDLEAFSR